MEGALRKKQSNSFHQVIVAEKKDFPKNLYFTFIIGISLTFAVGNYLVFLQELGYKNTMEIALYRFCKIKLPYFL